MLNPRQNLLETIKGGKPDRLVNQFEAFKFQWCSPVSCLNPFPECGLRKFQREPGSLLNRNEDEVQHVCEWVGKKYFIPNLTMGDAMSSFEGVYVIVTEEIDKTSKIMFKQFCSFLTQLYVAFNVKNEKF